MKTKFPDLSERKCQCRLCRQSKLLRGVAAKLPTEHDRNVFWQAFHSMYDEQENLEMELGHYQDLKSVYREVRDHLMPAKDVTTALLVKKLLDLGI